MKKTDIKKVIGRLIVGNVEKAKLQKLEKVLVIWLDDENAKLKGAQGKVDNKAVILACGQSQDIGIACWPLFDIPKLFQIKAGKPILLDLGRQMVDLLVKDQQLTIWATCQNGYVKPLALKYMLLKEMEEKQALAMLEKTNPEVKLLPHALWQWLDDEVGSGSVREVIRWR